MTPKRKVPTKLRAPESGADQRLVPSPVRLGIDCKGKQARFLTWTWGSPVFGLAGCVIYNVGFFVGLVPARLSAYRHKTRPYETMMHPTSVPISKSAL